MIIFYLNYCKKLAFQIQVKSTLKIDITYFKENLHKELNQAIGIRFMLRNEYLKSNFEIAKHKYKKQKSYCVKLLRLIKQKYCQSLHIKNVTDNRTSWKTISPLF